MIEPDRRAVDGLDRSVLSDTDASAREPSALALAMTGAAAVATAFGMARYGYGLLLPDIKADLLLGATTLGAIGTAAYITYVVAALLVSPSIARIGERGTVVAGGALAVFGTAIVAAASGPVLLAAGIAIAGASCGLIYPPFADAVSRLPAATRDRTLAAINCGTGWGVATAAPIAIVGGNSWRHAYLGFALCALVTTVSAARVLPRARRGPGTPTDRAACCVDGRDRGRTSVRAEAIPLLACAALVGLGSAGYWTYAVDHVRDAGGMDVTAARLMLGVAGIASLLGTATADVVARLGARTAFTGCAMLGAGALAAVSLMPGHSVAILAAAVAFGASYNALVAIQALWSARLYPDRPSTGLAFAMGANAAGLLWGPLAGGVLADAVGMRNALLAAAGVVAAAALLAPRGGVLTPTGAGPATAQEPLRERDRRPSADAVC